MDGSGVGVRVSGMDVDVGFGVGSAGSFVAGVFDGSATDRPAVDESGVLVGWGDMATAALESCEAIAGGAAVAVGPVGTAASADAGVGCGVGAAGTAVASIFTEGTVGIACTMVRAGSEGAGGLGVDEVPWSHADRNGTTVRMARLIGRILRMIPVIPATAHFPRSLLLGPTPRLAARP